MLAIDTNLIVRYLTGDHPKQSAKAKALIDGNDVFVCTTVLLEADWVLRTYTITHLRKLRSHSLHFPDYRASNLKMPF